jgi:hypothetical protein
MSVAPPPATYTATNDLNALKNIFVPQYQFSNGYYHAIVNTQLPGNVAVGNTTTGFLLTVNGAPTMTLSDLQNWSYYRATSNLVMNSNSITTVSKLTFVGGNTTNAFTIDAPNGLLNVSAYYLRGNFIEMSGGLTAWARYPANANVNVSGYTIIGAASVSLSSGGTITNPASNVIGFSNTAFGETMRITQSGQLSVGTSAQFPGFSLVVNGSSQFKSSIVMTTSAYTSSSNSFFVNTVPTTVGNVDIQMGALGGNTNLYVCTGGTLTQRLKLDSNGNFTVMNGKLTTTDSTLAHSVGGITFQNQNISAGSLSINGVPYTGGVAAGVATINNTLSGNVIFTAGTNISLYTSGNSIVIGVSGSTGGTSDGVTTLNNISGAVTLVAGTNISLSRTGNTGNIVISVSGLTSGVTSICGATGALALIGGTNISLGRIGSNFTIQSTVSGIYGGVLLSGSYINASGISTPSTGGYSTIGGAIFPGSGYITASGVFTDFAVQNIIGGVTLQNNIVTVSAVTISGSSAFSIVSMINGIAGNITMVAAGGVQLVTGDNTIGILGAPPSVTLLGGDASNVNFADAFTGDIFITTEFPTSGLFITFNPDYTNVAAGTNFRLKNASGVKIVMTYDVRYANLPNIDDEGTGSFEFGPTDTILFVKSTTSDTIYYNVN